MVEFPAPARKLGGNIHINAVANVSSQALGGV